MIDKVRRNIVEEDAGSKLIREMPTGIVLSEQGEMWDGKRVKEN